MKPHARCGSIVGWGKVFSVELMLNLGRQTHIVANIAAEQNLILIIVFIPNALG